MCGDKLQQHRACAHAPTTTQMDNIVKNECSWNQTPKLILDSLKQQSNYLLYNLVLVYTTASLLADECIGHIISDAFQMQYAGWQISNQWPIKWNSTRS